MVHIIHPAQKGKKDPNCFLQSWMTNYQNPIKSHIGTNTLCEFGITREGGEEGLVKTTTTMTTIKLDKIPPTKKGVVLERSSDMPE
jgi:hypothetical protein